MFETTLTYTDFNDVERTETFAFNLTEAELQDWQLSVGGGMEQMLNAIINAKDIQKINDVFISIIHKSYGVKSPDGRRFIKDEETLKEFTQTQAYSDFYTKLSRDSEFASEFINGILPKKLREQLANMETPAPSVVK